MKQRLFSGFRKVARALAGRGLGLRRIPGLVAFYQWLYSRLRPGAVVLIEAQGSKMFVKPDDYLTSSLINLGVWEPEETALFHSMIKAGMTVLDVGANMGYYTLLAAKLVGETGRVYAFEPDPANYELLKKSVQLNRYAQVTVFNVAVADEIGRAKLYLDSAAYFNSLSAQNIIRPAGSVEVEKVTLDSLYAAGTLGKRIDFIKIDVQGAEAMVVKGAQRIIEENRPMVAMELEPSSLRGLGGDALELLRLFERYGYAARAIETAAGLSAAAALQDIAAAAEKLTFLNVVLTAANQTTGAVPS